MTDLLVPVAHCKTCKSKVPVVILGYTFGEEAGELEGTTAQIVWCPFCESIMSVVEDIKVEWYEPEELPKVTNYKVNGVNE